MCNFFVTIIYIIIETNFISVAHFAKKKQNAIVRYTKLLKSKIAFN